MIRDLKILLAAFNVRVEKVASYCWHIHTTPAHLETVRELILARMPTVDNVMAYDDRTLGVFTPMPPNCS